MQITVQSALTNEILACLHVQPDDTIEHLQHEAARLAGLEKGRHFIQLVLPKQRIRRIRQRITKDRDVKTTTVEQVGWSDESNVFAVIQAEAEISVTLKRGELEVRNHRLHRFEVMHDKVQRICELSGCSRCVVDRERDYEWSTVRFSGVPADADAAKTATEKLLSQGCLPMLYKAFFKQTYLLQGEFAFTSRYDDRHFLDHYMADSWIESIEAVFHVEIDYIPWTGKGKYKPGRMIAGEAEAVLAAADVLEQLDTRCCSNLTHPGQVSEEYFPDTLLCRSPCLALAAWSSESQLRHISRNWKVGVYPFLNPCKFVLVGEPGGVCRAKAYLERQMQILCQHELHCQRYGREAVERFGYGGMLLACQRYGRDAVERFGYCSRSDDFWGEDELEEDWMEPYLYKRR